MASQKRQPVFFERRNDHEMTPKTPGLTTYTRAPSGLMSQNITIPAFWIRAFLVCSTCLQPSTKPMHRCSNECVPGALCITCIKCMASPDKVKCKKLPTDVNQINPCRLIDDVILTMVKFPCGYEKYGCKESFPMAEMDSHMQTCPFIPFSCFICTKTMSPCPETFHIHVNLDHPFVRDYSLTNQCYLQIKRCMPSKLESAIITLFNIPVLVNVEHVVRSASQYLNVSAAFLKKHDKNLYVEFRLTLPDRQGRTSKDSDRYVTEYYPSHYRDDNSMHRKTFINLRVLDGVHEMYWMLDVKLHSSGQG